MVRRERSARAISTCLAKGDATHDSQEGELPGLL